MKKRTLIFSAAAILIVALAVPFAVAQRLHAAGRGHGCTSGSSMMMFGRMGKAKAALGLTDQQATDKDAQGRSDFASGIDGGIGDHGVLH